MIFAKRIAVLILSAFVVLSFILFRSGSPRVLQQDAHFESVEQPLDNSPPLQRRPLTKANGTSFDPFLSKGDLKPAGESYTRGLVIGRLTRENTTWLDDYLAATPDPSLQTYLYIVDDQHAPLHTPMNKGNEAMVYLTYILDHYDNLPDVSIFMHPHQKAWHTPELLNHDAVEILKRLNSERVIREGYMNLRCYWDPGCPERVYPDKTLQTSEKREEIAVATAWDELFPGEALPDALGAPCCAQFAVAKHRIQAIPKDHFHRYRNWLMRTTETDWTSGRVFEYVWQKIFSGQAKLCPDARTCYCDGYAICFSTSEEMEAWFDNHHWWREAMTELDKWNAQAEMINSLGSWRDIETLEIDIPMPGRNVELQQIMATRFKKLTSKRFEAIRNGTDPEIQRLVGGHRHRT